MESFFTKIVSFMVVAAFFVGCSDSSSPSGPDPEPEPTETEVGIESFGFYQEDNPEVLFQDYIVENISNAEIDINLPAEADVTGLVARFTTTENDVVTVQDTEQVSGETSNDFTNPLEYLVSEGDENEIYTVTVGEMASAVWSELMPFTSDTVRDISLSVNPANSMPSVAFISDRDDFDARKLNVISFENGGWSYNGGTDFTSARARNPYLTHDANGVPYVSFGDDTEDPTQAAVMKFTNSSWGYVGGSAFTGVESDVSAVAVGEDETVYGFYIDDNDRGTKLKTSTGGSWTDSPIAGRNGYSRTLEAKEMNGDIYVGVLDFGGGQSVSVYKYSDGSWTTLADHMKDSEAATVYYYDVAMDVDTEGNVYVAYAEDSEGGSDYQLKVQKYSSEDESWSIVGSPIASTETRTFDITVDVYGNPIFLYTDDTDSPTAVAFDDETNNWSDSISLANAEADDLNIAVAPNGVIYASYTVDNEIKVHKYDSPDNN